MRKRTVVFGAVGVFLALGVLGSLSGGGSAKPTPTAAPIAAATAAPTAAPPTATRPAAPTATVAVPTPTIKPAAQAKVGQRVEAGGIAVTVNSVSRAETMGPYAKPKAGDNYLLVDLTIESVSRDDAPYNPLYCKVKDADGYDYGSTLGVQDKALSSGKLAKGEKARGVVAFEVPVKASGFVLTYDPIVILGGYTPIKFALD